MRHNGDVTDSSMNGHKHSLLDIRQDRNERRELKGRRKGGINGERALSRTTLRDVIHVVLCSLFIGDVKVDAVHDRRRSVTVSSVRDAEIRF